MIPTWDLSVLSSRLAFLVEMVGCEGMLKGWDVSFCSREGGAESRFSHISFFCRSFCWLEIEGCACVD